jgi:hypothetical protein
MGKFFSKYDYFLYFIVAILSLIAFLARHSTIWLVLFFGWLSIGFTHVAKKSTSSKVKKKNLQRFFFASFFLL